MVNHKSKNIIIASVFHLISPPQVAGKHTHGGHNFHAYMATNQDTNWYHLGGGGGKGLLCFSVTYISLKHDVLLWSVAILFWKHFSTRGI